MLQAPFVARALSHCQKLARVTWGDGAESTFHNTWLRASIRDERFFDTKACNYRDSHLDFLIKEAPITHARQSEDGESIKVKWEDHSTVFDASWLRAQDLSISSSLLPAEYQQIAWAGDDTAIPVFEYSHRIDQVKEWMQGLKKWGLIVIQGVPQNEQGFQDCMHVIGPLSRRNHPTDIYTAKPGIEQSLASDPVAYGSEFLGAHTDTSYYREPHRLQGFMCSAYEAPDKDTVNFYTDGLRVVEEFRKNNPEAFRLLTRTKCRKGRLRLTVEEECDPSDARIYEWSIYTDTPIILLEGDTVKRLHLKFTKHAGVSLEHYNDSQVLDFYRAQKAFEQAMDDSKNFYKFVLRPGTCTITDNYRICHGRNRIHPSTRRTLLGGYIADATYMSRWRVLMGRASGLENKWLYGCSDESLDILSKRKQ